MKGIFKYSLVLFALLYLGAANASIDVYSFSNEDNRTKYHALTKELRCPKCQNQDIADSNSPIASDMRREVHRLLEEGKDHDQVVQFMVERFGEFVTYKPKVSSETYVLWYGPWVLIGIGILIIAFVLRSKVATRKRASAKTDNVKESPQNGNTHSRVEALLKKYDETTEQEKS